MTPDLTPRAPRPSRRLWLGCALAALLVAVSGYWWTGSPALLGNSAGASGRAGAAGGINGTANGSMNDSPSGAVSTAQVEDMVEKLRQRLQGEPDNAEGWAMLARSLNALGKDDEALPAYRKAIALNGNDATLLAALIADYADLLAVRKPGGLAGEPMQWVERALLADPRQPKALLLAGTAAFDRKDYAGAVSHWARAADSLPADAPVLAQVRANIDEARRLGGLPPAAPADVQASPASEPTRAAAAGPGASPASRSGDAGTIATVTAAVSGTVTLSRSLAGQVQPGDTLFIFARAATGPRMPLAILRKQVKDLPVQFTLDDSLAMSPQMKLSGFPQVIVGARISRSGNAMPQPGDFQVLSAPVASSRSGLKLEIAQRVEP